MRQGTGSARSRAGIALALCLVLGTLGSGTFLSAVGLKQGPPDEHTFAGKENCCCDCHDHERNTGNGTVRLEGVPATYVPGARYTVQITVEMVGQSVWGFELSVRDRELRQAGRLEVADSPVQFSSTGGIQFAKHAPGAETGQFGVWRLLWLAPKAGMGQVTFFVAANAANGDGTSNNDWIYTTSVSSTEDTATAVVLIGITVVLVALIVTALIWTTRKRRSAGARATERRSVRARNKPKNGRRARGGPARRQKT